MIWTFHEKYRIFLLLLTLIFTCTLTLACKNSEVNINNYDKSVANQRRFLMPKIREYSCRGDFSSPKQDILIQVKDRHCLQNRFAGSTGTEQYADVFICGNIISIQTVHQLIIGGYIYNSALHTLHPAGSARLLSASHGQW